MVNRHQTTIWDYIFLNLFLLHRGHANPNVLVIINLLLLMDKIPNNHLECIQKGPVKNGINYQPQLVNAGFLNHQEKVPWTSQ